MSMRLHSQTTEISKETKMEKVKWEIKGCDSFGQSEINSISEEFPLAGGSALKITLMAISPKSVCILEYSGQKEGSRKIGKLVLESEGWTESYDYVYGKPMKVELSSLPSVWLRVTVTPHLSVDRLGYAAEVPIGAETSVAMLPEPTEAAASTPEPVTAAAAKRPRESTSATKTANTNLIVMQMQAKTANSHGEAATVMQMPESTGWVLRSLKFCLFLTPQFFFPCSVGRTQCQLKLTIRKLLEKSPCSNVFISRINALLENLLKVCEQEDEQIVTKSQKALREIFDLHIWTLTPQKQRQMVNSRLNNLTKELSKDLCENVLRFGTVLPGITFSIKPLLILVNGGALESSVQMISLAEAWFKVCKELKQIQKALTDPPMCSSIASAVMPMDSVTESAVTPTSTISSPLSTSIADCAERLSFWETEVQSLTSSMRTCAQAVHSLQADLQSHAHREFEILDDVQPPQEPLIVRVSKFIIEATAHLLIEAPESDETSGRVSRLKEKLKQLAIECDHSDENPILLAQAKMRLFELNVKSWKPRAKLLPVMSTLRAAFPLNCWKQTPQQRRQRARHEMGKITQAVAELVNHLRSCGLTSALPAAENMQKVATYLLTCIHYLEREETQSPKAQNQMLYWASNWLALCGAMTTNRQYFESLYNSPK